MKSFITILFFFLFTSCVGPKEYQIGNKMVTKKKYERGLNRITKKYVKSATEDQLKTFLELNVMIDTTNVN